MGFEDGVLASQPRPAVKRRKPLRRLERVQTAAKKAELFAAHADYAGPRFLGCSDRQAGRGQQRRAGGQRTRAREEGHGRRMPGNDPRHGAGKQPEQEQRSSNSTATGLAIPGASSRSPGGCERYRRGELGYGDLDHAPA